MSTLPDIMEEIGAAAEKYVMVAMSGGVDSCLVAAVARDMLGQRCRGTTIQSELTWSNDMERAVSVANGIRLRHSVLHHEVLGDDAIRANGHDRCYHCKRSIFSKILKEFPRYLVLDGTNADDDPERPGRKAALEMGVRSPLLEAGMGKRAVREMAKGMGLFNWNAPSESCVATRIKTGIPLSEGGLNKVRIMETFFHERGVPNLRVYHDNLMATVVFKPQYAEIVSGSRDNFAALVKRIGLVSCQYEEFSNGS